MKENNTQNSNDEQLNMQKIAATAAQLSYGENENKKKKASKENTFEEQQLNDFYRYKNKLKNAGWEQVDKKGMVLLNSMIIILQN